MPKSLVTWDVKMALTYLRSLSPVRSLNLSKLTKKLTVLMLLVAGQRGQTIHLLDVVNMTLTYSRASFRVAEPVKQTRPGKHINEIVFKGYAPDRRLCVVTVLKEYLQRTLNVRGTEKQLLLTTRSPYKGASRDTVRRWTRDVLTDSGIDMGIFTPHSTRSASTSKAATKLPLKTILKTAGWSNAGVFSKYYKKDIAKEDDFAKAILD